jgi:hypothetical protein
VLRRPELIAGAIFHEPPYIEVTSDPDAVNALIGASFEAGMAAGGRPAAFESFLRLVCHDEVIDGMDPGLRDRTLANADVFFDVDAAMSVGPAHAGSPAAGPAAVRRHRWGGESPTGRAAALLLRGRAVAGGRLGRARDRGARWACPAGQSPRGLRRSPSLSAT